MYIFLNSNVLSNRFMCLDLLLKKIIFKKMKANNVYKKLLSPRTSTPSPRVLCTRKQVETRVSF